MTISLQNWIRANREQVSKSNNITDIVAGMPRGIVTEFLLLLRNNDKLNANVVWDTPDRFKYYKVYLVNNPGELVLSYKNSTFLPTIESREIAVNFNSWIIFRTLAQYTDYMSELITNIPDIIYCPAPITANTPIGLGLVEVETPYGKCSLTNAGYYQLIK